jgi:nitrite reductase/ring-hydroxylating ferredoxin subunit
VNWSDHENAPRRGTELCKLDEIEPDAAKELVIADGDGRGADAVWPFRMFIVRRGERVWGYVNTCPHQHIPLNYFPDRFVSEDKQSILCANHGALFNFDDGLCVAGPCVGRSLQQVPIAVRDGVVSIG